MYTPAQGDKAAQRTTRSTSRLREHEHLDTPYAITVLVSELRSCPPHTVSRQFATRHDCKSDCGPAQIVDGVVIASTRVRTDAMETWQELHEVLLPPRRPRP